MKRSSTSLYWIRFVAGGMLAVCMMAVPYFSQTAPDNTRQNKEQPGPTAENQGKAQSDRTITQKVRKAIHEDKSLSTYAHNVKIITNNGTVTLRGPVKSDDEKNAVQAKAAEVAGANNVINDLEVAPPKH